MPAEQGCGLCGFYPQWLRDKATSKMFTIVYGLLGTIQSMSFIYVSVTLTTLEKRFKIPSRTTGIILSGNEISQVLSLLLIFYGGSGHRPRWIAVGVALSALSCLVLALPHFIYGPGRDALALTKEHLDQTLLNATSGSKESHLCPRTSKADVCDEDSLSDISLFPRLVIFMSQFILGIGTTLYYGLGQTYLDDNSKKKSTPMLLGFMFALRTVGPVFGFLLSWLCLSLYIDPTLHPVITQKDPRWMGAWWLGWIILGLTMGIFSVLVAMFPKELPKPVPAAAKRKDGETPLKLDLANDKKSHAQHELQTPQKVSPNPVPSIKEFPKALMRLCTNRIILYNNLSAIAYVLGASGFITFFAKYMEVQYGTSAGGGSAVAGPMSLMGMVLGFLISGIVISKFKPGPRILLGWNVIVGCSFICGMISYTFLGCPDAGVQGLDVESATLNLSFPCNMGCGCDGIKYSPVCHEASGTTFFSACHAGCNTTLDDHEFGSCACVSNLMSPKLGSHLETEERSTVSTIADIVKAGPCPRDCQVPYLWFIILTSIVQTLACSGKIGNVLVNYRAVATEDKSIAQGFSLMLISLFALIPGPIIYGAVIDSTCLIWDESCGQRGNCWFYDKDRFRYMVNFSATAFIVIGVLFDVGVWYLVKGLDLYGASDDDVRREFAKTDDISKPTVGNGVVNSDQELERRNEVK